MTEESRARLQALRAEAYQAQRRAYQFHLDQQGQSGRWLVVTIAAAQIAGVFFIGNLPIPWQMRELSLWPHLLGLVLILLSGLLAWHNWSQHARHAAQALDTSRMGDLSLPSALQLDVPGSINFTARLAWWLAICSVLTMILSGALLSAASRGWSPFQ